MELSSGQISAMKSLAMSNYNVIRCDTQVARALQRRKLVKLVGVSWSRLHYVVPTAKGQRVGEKLIA